MYVAFEVEKIEINPQQLCQHLLVAGISNIEFNELFQYELCSYPASLFDSKLLIMRLPDKADLQNDLVKKVPACVATALPFVANPRNKQKFINLMSSQMEKEGIHLNKSSGDADYGIAMSACALAQARPARNSSTFALSRVRLVLVSVNPCSSSMLYLVVIQPQDPMG